MSYIDNSNSDSNNVLELFDNLPLLFKGKLNESIQKSCGTSLDLFALYVIDTNEDQTNLLKCISHQTVTSFVKSKCVLYKIKKESTEFEFFSQHYPEYEGLGSCFYFFDISGNVFKTEELKKGFTFISTLSLFKTSYDYFDKQKSTLNTPNKIEQKSKERRLVLQKLFCTKPVPKSEQPIISLTKTSDSTSNNTTTTTQPISLTKTTDSNNTTTTTTTTSPTIVAKKPIKSPEVEKPYIPNTDYIDKAVMTTLIFKLTNGETLKAEFNVSDRLKDIKEFVKNNRTDEKRPFDMITVYPKHTFTPRELELTLLQLNLVPSATITLNPLDVSTKIEKKSSASAVIHPSPPSSSNSDSSPGYFASVKNYFSGFFGAVDPESEQQHKQDKEKEKNKKDKDNKKFGSIHGNSSGGSSGGSSGKSTTQKRTNIHQIKHDNEQQLQQKDPKDDPNSYYNGNSTQFNGK